MKIMTVRATEELMDKLNKAAKDSGYTRNALILNILWEWLRARELKKGR